MGGGVSCGSMRGFSLGSLRHKGCLYPCFPGGENLLCTGPFFAGILGADKVYRPFLLDFRGGCGRDFSLLSFRSFLKAEKSRLFCE